ncbi:hypothetical protein MK805_09555 [Shimazuella sp. AN120528]|uniref:hypothetical protein n=1 Tax=Shimazuella soli TaxID=1892854 RepID=UPI001F0F74E4|nr:hypothetical protein [Shimazuella soli]MCH5585213.1 hypothetical protein [Shimazuella soli]
MDLDWIIENKTIPLEVTNVLQEIADKHQYSVDVMHQHKQEVVEELRCLEKEYIVRFLFPYGLDHHERWIHALIRMEIRRLQQIANTKHQR